MGSDRVVSFDGGAWVFSAVADDIVDPVNIVYAIVTFLSRHHLRGGLVIEN